MAHIKPVIIIDEGERSDVFASTLLDEPTDAHPDSHRWWVLLAVVGSVFCAGLTVTILTVAVDDIGKDFNVSRAIASLVVTAPFTFRAVFIPAFGRITDRYGRRRVWLWGFGVSTLASFACAFAPNVGSLVALRAVSAIAGAAVLPSSLALLSDAFPPHERVRAMAWWSAASGFAPLLGIVLGGIALEHLSWRWLFIGQAPPSIITFIVGAIVLEERAGDRRPIDVCGIVLSIIACGALVLAVNRGLDSTWDYLGVGTVLCLSVGGLAAWMFVRVELRHPAPVVPIHLFRIPSVRAAMAATFWVNFAYLGGFNVTTYLMRDPSLYGMGPRDAALAVSPRAATLALLAPVGGWLCVRVGSRRVGLIGASALVGSMVWFAVGGGLVSYPVLLPGLLLSGLALAFVAPPATAAVANAAPREDLGIVGGTLSLMQSMGSSLGIAAMQSVVLLAAVTPKAPGADAFRWSFVVGSVAAVLCLIAARRCGEVATRQ